MAEVAEQQPARFRSRSGEPARHQLPRFAVVFMERLYDGSTRDALIERPVRRLDGGDAEAAQELRSTLSN